MAIERWEIDSSHSGIHFSVRHLVIAKVRGQFSRWSGAVIVPDGDFSRATVEAVIDPSSIETGVADRDVHLKSADFFDVAQFPEVIFKASRVEPAGDDLRLVGQLTIKGIDKVNKYRWLKNGAMTSIGFLGAFMIAESLGVHMPEWLPTAATVGIVGEDVPMIGAAVHHVMPSASIVDSQRPGHWCGSVSDPLGLPPYRT